MDGVSLPCIEPLLCFGYPEHHFIITICISIKFVHSSRSIIAIFFSIIMALPNKTVSNFQAKVKIGALESFLQFLYLKYLKIAINQVHERDSDLELRLHMLGIPERSKYQEESEVYKDSNLQRQRQ